MKKRATIALVFALIAGSAQANTPAAESEYDPRDYPKMTQCFNAAEQANNGILADFDAQDCYQDEISRQEKRMNAALAKLNARKPAQKAQLKREQARWLNKRKADSDKEFEGPATNGYGVMLKMTADRADALEKRLAR
ncbi:MAG: DUF1311 domain-containing protein [Kingella sp. (in: b-proteobacteria)]|jgi:hypothetical protein|uniref:lysozyme inhibitor LprI family protein n=1 Tax=Kingella oralis TaxID=505 RepID=UPI000F1F91A5|nr:MAG: DUF1311 domain-containing protein [Kingella sp. (in: b-proteobacteria)]